MSGTVLLERVEGVRRFARFYTRQIGVLQEGLLRTPYSLTEARVIYELAQREPTTASWIGQELGLDGGYLSRLLRSFEDTGLIERRTSPEDGRQALVTLTSDGRAAFVTLERASRSEIESMLRELSEEAQQRLLSAMGTIERLLTSGDAVEEPYTLRGHRTGDIGWVIHRHGVLYNQEFGWEEDFEGLVAQIAAQFIQNFDPECERCWIAERDGARIGSIFLVRHPEREGVARLRMLLVEPEARGLGLGRRLVQECTRFARAAGYSRITLWTNSVLHAARKIYIGEGYQLMHEEPNTSFGSGLTSQTWELEL